jgi:ABC-type transport system involved in multi-copper enzyme maturation permease subunit
MSFTAQLGEVVRWDLRRTAASRINFGLLMAVFVFFAGLVAFKHEWLIPVETGPNRGAVLDVLGSTGLGAIFEIVALLLLFFGMLIPFVSADAVARDHRLRMHEILMATPLSSAAYVVGRFIAALVVSLVLAVTMLAGVVAADVMIASSDETYPGLDLLALGYAWLVLVLPAIVVLSGASFYIGTRAPALATPAKVAVLIVWVMLTVVVDIGHGLGWFGYWTPTGNGVLKVLPAQVASEYAALVASHAGPAAQLNLEVQQRLPDLTPWIGPHLGLVLIGAACALAAALQFDRFRGQLG